MSKSNPTGVTPEGVLPTMGSMAEVLAADPRNAERPVSVLDATNVRLLITFDNDGMAQIKCNMPKPEAARVLRRIAQSLESDARQGR